MSHCSHYLIKESFLSRNRLIDLENELTVPQREGCGGKDGLGVWDWCVHTLYLRWIINKDLLSSTGTSAQYCVITILLPSGASTREPLCQSGRWKSCEFDPWVQNIPWRRVWQPTLAFLPRESHGQKSLATVHGVTSSWTRLNRLSTHTCPSQHLEQGWTGPYFSQWIDGHQCNYAETASQLSCLERLPDSLGHWSCWSPRSARSCFQQPQYLC